MNFRLSFLAFVAFLLGATGSNAAAPRSLDLVAVPGLPSIGKWLLSSDGEIAHWLGDRVEGKLLDEPINVVLRVKAGSEVEAIDALARATSSAGFASRSGHSTGYKALIGQASFNQFPREEDHAFSDANYLLANNHGRFFGPARDNNSFVFVGAFSREGANPLRKLQGLRLHYYLSFLQAREEFATQMERKGGAKNLGLISLENSVQGDSENLTGDHDGMAVLLEL